MFARSAPARPAVCRATVCRSTSAASGLPRVCTSRMRSRPARSGGETSSWRSKRPGRRSAGSRSWMRFEAPITITWSPVSNPSSSTRSWFSVWSCSRLKPLPERAAPTASSSSMKMIDGRVLARGVEELADAGRTEAREHLDERGRALRVEARARLVGDRLREQRLAGTGRPVEQEPLRHAGAERRELLRVAEEVDDLLELRLRVLDAGDVVERDRRLRVRLGHLRLDLRHQLDRAPDQEDEDPEEGDRQPREQAALDFVQRARREARAVPSAVGWAFH